MLAKKWQHKAKLHIKKDFINLHKWIKYHPRKIDFSLCWWRTKKQENFHFFSFNSIKRILQIAFECSSSIKDIFLPEVNGTFEASRLKAFTFSSAFPASAKMKFLIGFLSELSEWIEKVKIFNIIQCWKIPKEFF